MTRRVFTRRRRRVTIGVRRQRGFAMIAILTLIVLISAYLIVSALNRTTAEISNSRGQRNTDVLVQAKSALIAYAASEQWQLYKGQSTNQPGALPCPDWQNDDGNADCTGSTTSSMIGRLPWKTIGADDLRDSSGERLWYALSHNFRKLSGTTVINSDTQGQLSVIGSTPASSVVAIVFAPGPPIQGQDRTAGHNNAAAYLEGFNPNDQVNYIFTSSASPSSTYNDRLVVITQADLMAAVEPVVAARMERDVKPYLQAYLTQWGRFPFPAPFAPDLGGPGDNSNAPSSPPHARAQTQYTGDIAQSSGLLPLTASLAYPWTAGSGSVNLVSGTAVISSVSCNTVASSSDTPSTGSGWQCTFTLGPVATTTSSRRGGRTRYTTTSIISDPKINMQGGVGNAAISFAQLPDATTVGNRYAPASSAINGTLAGTAAGTANYQATYSSLNCSASASQNNSPPPPPAGCNTTYSMRVTIPDVTASPVTSTSTIGISTASNTSPIAITTATAHNVFTGLPVAISGAGGNTAANGTWTVTVIDSTHFTLNGSAGNGAYTSGGTVSSTAAWFISNEWYRQTYYAVSPGYLPGGTGGCTPCLTVNNIALPNNDKRAILILAGSALDGSMRPSANLSSYLEGENLTPADFIYEHRQGSPTSTNDRVVVVSP